MAFGLITYEAESDSDYSAYGEIRARLKTWDSGSIQFVDLASRPCTREDLGLSDDTSGSLFYPLFAPHRSHVEAYQQYLLCIDEDFEIYGDYSSGKASHLIV